MPPSVQVARVTHVPTTPTTSAVPLPTNPMEGPQIPHHEYPATVHLKLDYLNAVDCEAPLSQHLSYASCDRWVCALPATTSTYRSRLAIDGGVLRQPPAPPVVRISRSMGVCCPSHHLHPSFTSRVRWTCAAPATSSVVRISRSIGVGRASHQLLLSTSSYHNYNNI